MGTMWLTGKPSVAWYCIGNMFLTFWHLSKGSSTGHNWINIFDNHKKDFCLLISYLFFLCIPVSIRCKGEMVLPDCRNMPPSEVKLLNFIANLINSCRSSPRFPLPCMPDCNSHLMLSSRWPKIHASRLSVCDNLWTAFSVTLGPRLLMPWFMQLFLC